MKKLSSQGPGMASTKGDGIKAVNHGKEVNGATEAAATAVINGSMNYNSNEKYKSICGK